MIAVLKEQGDEGPHWQSLLLFKRIFLPISAFITKSHL